MHPQRPTFLVKESLNGRNDFVFVCNCLQFAYKVKYLLSQVFLFIVFVLKQTLTSFYNVYIYHYMIFNDAVICCYSIYVK